MHHLHSKAYKLQSRALATSTSIEAYPLPPSFKAVHWLQAYPSIANAYKQSLQAKAYKLPSRA